jgi:hypothetical protein
MAIFSRRTLQRLIDENASFLSRKQVKKHVEALNVADEHSLGYEWEIVLLNVFSKLGDVRHEPPLGKTPDIHFISRSDSSQGFVADIVTVSDRGIDDRYPIQELHIRFSDIVYKKGLRNGAFSIFVGSEVDRNAWPRPNPRLKLPHRKQLDTVVFNKAFYDFLDAIALDPQNNRDYVVANTTPPIDIRISYDPAQTNASRGWPAYNQLTSLVRNTVYSRLEEKAANLKQANYEGHRAIIVCDGGYGHLNTTRYFYEDHIDDVFRHFLKEHPQISFILTFAIKQNFGFNAEQNTVATLYPGRAFADIGGEIEKAINEMQLYFPEPEQSALNAGHQLTSSWKYKGLSFIGGGRMTDDEIKISTRGLLELLSGQITQERFLKLHSWAPMANLFEAQLNQGRLITSITIENRGERDDDWAVIRFGEPDPAISPFRVPPECIPNT